MPSKKKKEEILDYSRSIIMPEKEYLKLTKGQILEEGGHANDNGTLYEMFPREEQFKIKRLINYIGQHLGVKKIHWLAKKNYQLVIDGKPREDTNFVEILEFLFSMGTVFTTGIDHTIPCTEATISVPLGTCDFFDMLKKTVPDHVDTAWYFKFTPIINALVHCSTMSERLLQE